jgi:hypothetical protein
VQALCSPARVQAPARAAAAPGGANSYGLGNATWIGTPRIVSWKPMATVYDDFLSEAECDYLLALSKPRLEPAMLVNSDVQKHVHSKSRTSHGAFFDSLGDPVLAMLTHRLGHVARIPPGARRAPRAALAAHLRICAGDLAPKRLCCAAS